MILGLCVLTFVAVLSIIMIGSGKRVAMAIYVGVICLFVLEIIIFCAYSQWIFAKMSYDVLQCPMMSAFGSAKMILSMISSIVYTVFICSTPFFF